MMSVSFGMAQCLIPSVNKSDKISLLCGKRCLLVSSISCSTMIKFIYLCREAVVWDGNVIQQTARWLL